MADICCLICGLTLCSKEVITNTELLSDILQGDNELLNTFIELDSNLDHIEDMTDDTRVDDLIIDKLTEHIWMNRIICITPNEIIESNKLDYTQGEMFVDYLYDGILKKCGNTIFQHDRDIEISGYLCHKDCYECITEFYGPINYQLINKNTTEYSTIPDKDYDIVNQYHQQFINHALIYFENPFILQSPLINEKNKQRIIIMFRNFYL